MPFSSGVYTLPTPALVAGQTVSSSETNTSRNDFATALNLTMLRNGTSTATANLPMGGYKLTGLGVATTLGDALSYNQAAVVSSLSTGGNLTFTGTGNRITGDFSNATSDSRVAFQNSVSNAGTTVHFIPNGTATGSTLELNTSSTIANSSSARLAVDTSAMYLQAGIRGTGTYLPMTFLTGGSERMRIATNGAVTFTKDQSIVNMVSSGAFNPTLNFYSSTATLEAGIVASAGGAALLFTTGASGTERMRITSSGNVGIGTSSPATNFQIDKGTQNVVRLTSGTAATDLIATASGDGQLRTVGAHPLIFGTNATERMRIDSSGNLLVGAATNVGKVSIHGTGTLLCINSDNGSDSVMRWASNTANKAIAYWSSASDRLYMAVASAGVYLANGGTSWASASDERVKDIIEPITNATEKLSNWRTVIGKYKTDEEGKRRSFLIAQDVLATFPEAVDADDENELGVRYQDTIPVLVKAIQELSAQTTALKAELDATKAEVAALKGV